jgi:putative protein-disulfide isomerase
MQKTLHYLFDPLCGWCYGAGAILPRLRELPGVSLALLPTGLFSDEGARQMDAAFAGYAWANDQRIERLTGQTFSQHYRQHVLGDRERRFDSGPATVALTAVSLTDPTRELEALMAIQHARYVDGSDITSHTCLADLLHGLGLDAAAARTELLDAELLGANQARLGRARTLMQEFDLHGVPALIVQSGARRTVLDLSTAYPNPQAWLNQLAAI